MHFSPDEVAEICSDPLEETKSASIQKSFSDDEIWASKDTFYEVQEDRSRICDTWPENDNGDGREEEDDKIGSLTEGDFFSSFSSYRTVQSSIVTSNSVSDSIDEKLETLDEVLGGRVGLRNLGNTCFLNSTLQCLLAVDELSLSLAECAKNGQISAEMKFSFELAKLFGRMWSKPQSETQTFVSNVVDPRMFKYALGQVDHRFEGYRQEDSQEALAIILDRLHEDLKRKQESLPEEQQDDKDGWLRYCLKEDSLVRKLFHGQLRSTLTCSRCVHASQTFDPFCFLNLPFPQPPAPESVKVERPKSKYFQVAFYNDSIVNGNTANLKVYKKFSNMLDFSSYFTGVMGFIAKLDSDGKIGDYRMRTSNVEESFFSGNVIAYRIDAVKDHYIVSLHLPNSEHSGFPIKISLPCGVRFSLEAFARDFLGSTLTKIVRFKFEEKLSTFQEVVFPAIENPEAYFKLGQVRNLNPFLTEVHIDIISPELCSNLFGDNLDEFFDNLTDSKEEEEDDEDDEYSDFSYNRYGSLARSPSHRPYDDSPYASFDRPYEPRYRPHEPLDSAIDSPYYSTHRPSYNSSYRPSHSLYKSSYQQKPRYPTQVSLSECFEVFLAKEPLTAECEKCKTTGDASKKLDLWRLPPILILHLKRFSFSSSSFYSYYGGSLGSKIDSKVEFPVDEPLVLTPLSSGTPVQYDLFAVSQHYGSLYGGHYTAVTWHRGQNCWSLADDSSIRRYSSIADWVNEAKSAGYVLFYRLRQ